MKGSSVGFRSGHQISPQAGGLGQMDGRNSPVLWATLAVRLVTPHRGRRPSDLKHEQSNPTGAYRTDRWRETMELMVPVLAT